MMYNKFFQLVESHKNKLAELVDCLSLMQKAIINFDYENYQKIIACYQKTITDISNIEKERIKILTLLLGDEINSKKDNFVDLIFSAFKIEDQNQKQLYLNLRNKITEFANEISKLNFQNMYLIEHSRKFIKDLLFNLYQSKNQKILDKKV